MLFLNKFDVVIYLLGIGLLLSCHQISDEKNLSTDQKEILQLYASQFLSEKNHKLYFKSEKKKTLLNVLRPPLSAEDFEKYELYNSIYEKRPKADTLFSSQELKNWSSQLAAYKQIRWNPNNFPKDILFINEKDIPDYLKNLDIPPSGAKLITVHYTTPPFIFDEKSALMYVGITKSVGNNQAHYFYFVKKNGSWKLRSKGPLTIIY